MHLDFKNLVRATLGAHPGDFDTDVGLANFTDLADHAAGSQHFITLGERIDHLFVFLLPLHLRADHQEIEHTKHQHNGKKAHEAFSPTGAKRGLGEGGGDKHGQSSRRENRQV